MISSTLRIYLVLIILFGSTFSGRSQDTSKDSTETHSPKRAVILSALVPSAGQAYNKKYWKMPIVYVGMGASIYFIIDNHKQYNRFRNEYLDRLNGNICNCDLAVYDESDLLTIQNTYRRWRDLSYIALGLVYVLQIVDASVDAHFFDWEKQINQDISMKFMPNHDFATRSTGFTLKLSF